MGSTSQIRHNINQTAFETSQTIEEKGFLQDLVKTKPSMLREHYLELPPTRGGHQRFLRKPCQKDVIDTHRTAQTEKREADGVSPEMLVPGNPGP